MRICEHDVVTLVFTPMPLKMINSRLLIIGCLASLLGACGQAGPLYLPQDTEVQSNGQSDSQQEPDKQAIQEQDLNAPETDLTVSSQQVQA